MDRVRVVTDSTACLSSEMVEQFEISVVPLRVTLGSRTAIDGVNVSSAEVARALRAKVPVSTSRPTPAEFATRYRTLLDSGASHVVSIHLSSALSGTWESAALAAQDFPHGAVRVIDSRSTAMGLGFPVLAAARRAAEGGSAADVQVVATATVDSTRTYFYVDTLEYLRRGGRIGSAAALFASTLSVKPLLQLVEGQIVGLEKVRTATKALARLVELTVRAAGRDDVDLAVHHVAAADRAAAVEAQLRDQVPRPGDVVVAELGPVVGAHLGPGVVGTVIVRR
ncbi:MAG TPA: DegV family protein [Jatrophihabitans sp.]|jgi:DegV family protein with EDD domain|nr:DegV family protein [Jatrophihabitans sp.]